MNNRHTFAPHPLLLTVLMALSPLANAADGITDLGVLNGGNFSGARGVNAAGDVVVGFADDGSAGNQFRAFRWTQASGLVSLGVLNGGSFSVAAGVNAAGDVVVGEADDGSAGNSRAFRWTQASGLVSLGVLNGGSFSTAAGVNAAGDVVVGNADDVNSAGNSRAFRWTQAGGLVSLGVLNGGTFSQATGVNAAGDVVVGNADDVNSAGNLRAFRWTQAGGLASLGVLNGGSFSVANGVNALGDVVVGQADDSSGFHGFRWTQASGLQTIEGWLTANGVAVNPAAPKTLSANAVNAAGNVVVGNLDNSHAFIARLTPGGGGLIDVNQFNQSLQGSAGIPILAIQNADQVIHGAHGSPMRGLLAADRQSFSVAGDWGRGDHNGQSADLGAGELSYGRGISDNVMVKIALGRTYVQQDTVFGGDTRADGTYVVPELIAKISTTPLYATFTGYYNAGDARVDRGYLNAGTPVISSGNASTHTTALRARLDWLNAVTFNDTAITPYTSLTYLHTKVGSYTESGGGFPVFWAGRTENDTQARLGADAVHKLDNGVNLLGRLEGVHRLESHGSDAQGQVLGLFAFDLTGQSFKQDWLRAAIGAESQIGKGIGSLTLNATTEAETARLFLAANYRWEF